MRRRKILAAGIVFCMCMRSLCACESQQLSGEDKVRVGVAYYNQSDTFLNELIACFKEELQSFESDDLEVTVTVRDAAGSQRTQDDQVKEMLDAGCNVLCVNLVDRADPSEIIDLARERDIPIIFFNREPVAEDLMQQDGLYYVGAEAEESGIMQENWQSMRYAKMTGSTATKTERSSMWCWKGKRDIRMPSSGQRMPWRL